MKAVDGLSARSPDCAVAIAVAIAIASASSPRRGGPPTCAIGVPAAGLPRAAALPARTTCRLGEGSTLRGGAPRLVLRRSNSDTRERTPALSVCGSRPAGRTERAARCGDGSGPDEAACAAWAVAIPWRPGADETVRGDCLERPCPGAWRDDRGSAGAVVAGVAEGAARTAAMTGAVPTTPGGVRDPAFMLLLLTSPE